MEINGTNIKMRKGSHDSLTLSITINGVAAPFVTGDVVKLGLKTHINDKEAVLVKSVTSFTDGKAVFNFVPEDTENLLAKEHKYDALVIWGDTGKVFYFIDVSNFTLTPSVTPSV